MALERHVIELTARDTVSRTLQNVGREADAAGRKAEDAGRRATRSTQDWGRAASALGTGLGVLTLAAVRLGNESEVSQQRLKASIEATGHSYDEYADSIDKASKAALQLAFDDEDALDAISKLTQGTGDAAKAIADLALVEDIARGRGIDLAAASNIVIAAEQGRIGSLKRLGIALDDNATSQEALAALQQKYSGQAEAYAETNAATWDRVGNRIENALEGIGGTLADYQGLILGLSSAGMALGPLGDAFEALGGKAKLASVGSKALSLALSPAGLLGITTALAAGMVYLVATTDEFTASAQAAERESADLANSYAALAASIEDVSERERTRQTYAGFQGFQEQGQKDLRTYQELQNALVEWESEFPQMESVAVGALNSISEAQQEWLDFNHDGRISMDEMTASVEQFGEKALLSSDQASAIGDNLTQALSHADVDVTRVLDDFDKLEAQWRAGTITGQEFANGVEEINRHWGDYTQYTLDAAKATTLAEYNQQGWTAAAMRHRNEINKDIVAFGDWIDAQHESGHLITENTAALIEQQRVLDQMQGAYNTVIDLGTDGLTGIGEATGALTADTSALDAQLDALAETLKTDLPGAANAAYARVVGFTSGMVNAIKTSKDWADALIAPVGTFSELDRMLSRGLIDIEDYNEAQNAQIDLTNDLARATDAMNIIQVKQADAVADGADATADYLEHLSKLPEAEQATALAWADSDIAGRAKDIADMAAQFGDMSGAQQDAFRNMVESAANTQPALADVLSSIGLIKESTDPSKPGWELSIDNAAAQGALSDTSEAIGALIEVLGVAYDLNIDAILDDSEFWNKYNNLPNSKTIYVHTVNGDYGLQPIYDALGGNIPWQGDTAAMGRVSAGAWTVVGEHGAEMVHLPGGSQVIPNHASRYMDKGRGGGDLIIQNMTVVANDPQSFMRQMRNYTATMERR